MNFNGCRLARVILCWICLGCFAIASCQHPAGTGAREFQEVKDSVLALTMTIEKVISAEGPVGWLHYFEQTPGFFMASGGQLVFPNIDSAKGFITNTLTKNINKINLKWSDIRIDPLSENFASIAANFHEDISYANGKQQAVDGYFTAVAELSTQGWKLRNAHWSIKSE